MAIRANPPGATTGDQAVSAQVSAHVSAFPQRQQIRVIPMLRVVIPTLKAALTAGAISQVAMRMRKVVESALAMVRHGAASLGWVIMPQPIVDVGAASETTPIAVPSRTEEAITPSQRLRRLRVHFRLTHVRVVALLAIALSIGAYAWYAAHDMLFLYGDAVSHFMIARQVFASRTPGLGQLGSVWLPLNHMFMLPLIWDTTLWRDGFAGAFPSMVGYVIGTLYLFRLARLMSSSVSAGWVGALAFALNPNVLYMQSTAMTEAVTLCLMIVGIYYFARWIYCSDTSALVWTAGAIAAATLIRYDGWFVAGVAFVLVVGIAWKRYGLQGAQAHALLFGIGVFSGIAAWIIYNGVIYGDPLYFYNGPYSAKAQQEAIALRGGSQALPTKGNLLLSAHVYAQSMIDSVSLPLAVLAGAGLLAFVIRRQFSPNSWPAYLALAPFAFNWLSLVLGISTLWTPDVEINGVKTFFNVRYGMMMIPAAAIFLAFLAAQIRIRHAVLIATILVGLMNPLLGLPYVVQEPLVGVLSSGHNLAGDTGTWIADHYTGGNILISGGDLQSAIFFSGLPYSDFVTSANTADFARAVSHPERHVEWIVVDPLGGNYDPAWAVLGSRKDWQRYFVLRAIIGTNRIYQRIGSN